MPLLKIRPSTRPFLDGKGKKIEGSIAEQTYLDLGGCKQWVLMRGKSIHNPLLVFLHGGPGMSSTGLLRYFNSELENHFLVVSWDQRGAGKSYSRKIDPKTMTIDQFVSDLHELIAYLKNRFGQKKVFLMGESWGSLLGTLYAHKYPQDLVAYIGIGQISDMKKSEKISLDFVIDEARARKNNKALRECLKIQEPGKHLPDIETERKWLIKFGGLIYQKSNLISFILKSLRVDECALSDFFTYFLGSRLSIKTLWPQIVEINLFQQVPRLDVPVFFLLGRHDYCVPSTLAAQYFEALKAPTKKLVWFENSGHLPHFEEAARFNQEMISIKNEVLNLK